jgi:DinB superfamily
VATLRGRGVAFGAPGVENGAMNDVGDRARLVARLADVPSRLAAAARAASPEPPTPGEWIPSDIVRHLIAVELEVWHPRLAQLEAEDHPHWPWVEPGPWPGEPGASLDRLLEIHAAARGTTIATLNALDHAGWAKTGTHATFGELDAPGLMTRAIDHDGEHLAGLAGAQPQENSAE